MTCTQAEPQLNALADRALPLWQAARVRRHLAACPACAAHLASIQRLDTAVRTWNDALLPDMLGPRIAAALPPSAALPLPRRTFSVRPAATGLTAAAAAFAAVLWFLPGQPGQPTIALADVEKAMANPNIVSSIDDTKIYGPKLSLLSHYRVQSWARRKSPAIALILLPGDTSHALGSLQDSRGCMAVSAQGQFRYWVSPANPDMTDVVQADFAELTQPLEGMAQMGHSVSKTYDVKGEPAMLAGVQVLKFTATMYNGNGGSQYKTQFTAWIDPTTKYVVQYERDFVSPDHSGTHYVRSKICYDETPRQSVFDISAPPNEMTKMQQK